jgi:hypothetical protein
MSDQAPPPPAPPAVATADEPPPEDVPQHIDPQRLLRIAGVVREVLEEARRIRPEPGAIDHIHRVHDKICGELREALPTQLYEELMDLTPEIRGETLEELALAHAEILGWLEGLFQGTQLALQMQAAQAMSDRTRPRLPSGQAEPPPAEDKRYL